MTTTESDTSNARESAEVGEALVGIVRQALYITEQQFGMKYPAAECALDDLTTRLSRLEEALERIAETHPSEFASPKLQWYELRQLARTALDSETKARDHHNDVTIHGYPPITDSETKGDT